MSADDTLNRIDDLIAKLDDHDPCPRCGKWWKLNPHFGVAKYTCCGVTREVNCLPRP